VGEDIYKTHEDNCAINSGGETEGKVHLENLDIDRSREMNLDLISSNLQRQRFVFHEITISF
jgi:hypothetical protein